MIKANRVYGEECPVEMDIGKVVLEGSLCIPANPLGVVVFVHANSSRYSERNKIVAQELRLAGMGTLLFDILTPEEESVDLQTGKYRFDIRFLANRVIGITQWLKQNSETKNINIGYFGASTGTAAALLAAAEHPKDVAALVSRGGRPDLIKSALPYMKSPTLLIVGGRDLPVIAMNRDASKELQNEKKLVVIPGATH